MHWIIFAAIAYFFYALTAILDKFLLNKKIPNPASYTFYVGLLSFFAVILIPFGVVWPGWIQLAKNLLVGAVFLLAIFLFILAVKKHEVSRAATMIGGLTPVCVFLLSYFFLGERLAEWQILSFLLLVSGCVLISFSKNENAKQKNKYASAGFALSVFAALVFAVYYVSAKSIFSDQPFLSAFFWSRMGSFLAAFVFLFFSVERKAIFATHRTAGVSGGAFFVANKILAALAFLSLNYAISLGSVTLVNAAQGIQYALLLILTIALAKKFPAVLREKINREILIQKAIAIALIVGGLFLLY